MAVSAKVAIPPGPQWLDAAFSLRAMASTSIGSSPLISSPKSSTAAFKRADELAAEAGDADAFDPVVGHDPHGDELAQHARKRRRADQRLLDGQPDELVLTCRIFIGTSGDDG